MNLSVFIDRPIFASVLSIIIIVVGLVAMQSLPISQFCESRRRWCRSRPIIRGASAGGRGGIRGAPDRTAAPGHR